MDPVFLEVFIYLLAKISPQDLYEPICGLSVLSMDLSLLLSLLFITQYLDCCFIMSHEVLVF